MALKSENFVHHFYQQHSGHCVYNQGLLCQCHISKKEELFFGDVLGIEKDNKLLWIHSFDTKTPCSHQNHKCLNLRVDFMLEINSPHNFLHLRQMRVEVRILVLPRQARCHTIAKNSTLNECQNPGSTTNQPETEASTHLCPETDNMLTCLTTSPMLAGTSLSVIMSNRNDEQGECPRRFSVIQVK